MSTSKAVTTSAPTGDVVDWAVHMLRLPDELRADERLAAGTLTAKHVDAIASSLADFHARARCDAATSEWGTLDAIVRNVRENFDEVDAAREGLLTAAQAREVECWQLDFLRDRARIFERRRESGRIREGHGDLPLEHFYLGDAGELTIIDCIEFSERFRCADVCADVAFLSMDLAAHGHVELAERLLARYARAADDYDLYALVDFYESYRAYVRGKVSALTTRQTSSVLRDLALADARRHFALALSAGRRSLLEPVVVAVGGVIASGKSTIADALGDRLSAPVIDADRTRKHLVGLAPTTHDTSGAFEGPYDLAMTDRVYAEMMLRASTVLESGRPVVLDASFRTEELRRAARDLAAEHGVPFLMVDCRARPEVCRERLVRREREASVSDGRLAIFDAFCARVEPAARAPSFGAARDRHRASGRAVAGRPRRAPPYVAAGAHVMTSSRVSHPILRLDVLEADGTRTSDHRVFCRLQRSSVRVDDCCECVHCDAVTDGATPSVDCSIPVRPLDPADDPLGESIEVGTLLCRARWCSRSRRRPVARFACCARRTVAPSPLSTRATSSSASSTRRDSWGAWGPCVWAR